MQSNIYAQKENGDLKLVAEIEGLNDPALAVDALLDEMPRLRQREFIVIDLDNVMVVEAGDEIVQPRRDIKVSASNGAVVAATEDEEEETEEEEEDEEPEAEVEEEAPKPRRGRPRKQQSQPKPASKPAAKRSRSNSAKSSGKKSGKSPFKSNPASAE